MFVLRRKSSPNIISYRHIGLSNSLTSTPSIIRALTNSGGEMSNKLANNDVSKVPFIAVVIFFVFDPGGRQVMVPVLPVFSMHTRGGSNLIPPVYLIFTIHTDAMSFCRHSVIDPPRLGVGIHIVPLNSLSISLSSLGV